MSDETRTQRIERLAREDRARGRLLQKSARASRQVQFEALNLAMMEAIQKGWDVHTYPPPLTWTSIVFPRTDQVGPYRYFGVEFVERSTPDEPTHFVHLPEGYE